jgi:hypothetical protein
VDALSVKGSFVHGGSRAIHDTSCMWKLLLAYGLTHFVGIKDCLTVYQMTVSIVEEEEMFCFISGTYLGNTEVSYPMAVGGSVSNKCCWNALLSRCLKMDLFPFTSVVGRLAKRQHFAL